MRRLEWENLVTMSLGDTYVYHRKGYAENIGSFHQSGPA